jgi:hypothetical protein
VALVLYRLFLVGDRFRLFSEERPAFDLAVFVGVSEVVALVVHAKEDVVVLPVEAFAALGALERSEIVFLFLLLLDPDEVEADLLACQLLATPSAFHDFDVEDFAIIFFLFFSAAIRAPFRSLSRAHLILLLRWSRLTRPWLAVNGREALVANNLLGARVGPAAQISPPWVLLLRQGWSVLEVLQSECALAIGLSRVSRSMGRSVTWLVTWERFDNHLLLRLTVHVNGFKDGLAEESLRKLLIINRSD